MAPAMNVRMWLHPATQRNIKQLRADGVLFIGPDEGDMACGEFGPGRHGRATRHPRTRSCPCLSGGPLKGKRIIVTAGPTLEPMDPVRFISNRSSGKQGYAIAEALARLGADVRADLGTVCTPRSAGRERSRGSKRRARCWPRAKPRCRRMPRYAWRRLRIGARKRALISRSRRIKPAALPALR